MTQCHSTINDNILNKCLVIKDAEIIRTLTSSLFKIIYPWPLLTTLLILIVILPMVFSGTSHSLQEKALRIYNVSRFTLLSMFHRFSYCYTLCTGLSLFIKQSAPCVCAEFSDTLQQNMPYIYSYASASMGLILIHFSSFIPIVMLSLGIFIIIVPSILYILCGWSSIAQALVSVLLACILGFISNRTSNKLMLIEDCCFLVFNVVCVFYIFYGKDPEYIEEWRRVKILQNFINAGIALFVELFLVIRFLIDNNWAYFTIEKGSMMVYDQGMALRSSLFTNEQAQEFSRRMRKDTIDGLIAFFIMIGFNVLRYVVRNYYYTT